MSRAYYIEDKIFLEYSNETFLIFNEIRCAYFEFESIDRC